MKVRKNGDTIFPYKPSEFPYQTSEQSETMSGESDRELYVPDNDINIVVCLAMIVIRA